MSMGGEAGAGLDGFGDNARRAVALAEAEAREHGTGRIGTEHLLLGLLAVDDSGAARALARAGVTLPTARRKVAEAIRSQSVDVGRRSMPLRRSSRAERALSRSFRFAQEARSAVVRSEHLLLAVLDVEGTAGQVLRGLGIDVGALRDSLEPREAESGPRPSVASGAARPSPTCPACGESLEGTLAYQVVRTSDAHHPARDVLVLSCAACGAVVGTAPA